MTTTDKEKDKKNKTEEMIEKLKAVQEKITKFEENYDSKYNHLEKRSRINYELDIKNEQLSEIQKSIISVDLGGKEVLTSSLLINNCKFGSILQDQIQNSNKIFLDIPYKYFKRILFIMRNKTKDSNTNKLRVELSEKLNEEMMTTIIKQLFKGDEIMKEVILVKKNIERTGNVMEFLYRKEVDFIPIPILNTYNDYNANYNNANYNNNYDY